MSIISEQDFLSQLYMIQGNNPPSQVAFPHGEKTIYDIDLATRTITPPPFLSVEKDHESSTIYFRVNRYFDYMDLSLLPGVIQYITPDGATHYYPIPFYDIVTEQDKDEPANSKMLVPWCVQGTATQFVGDVTFSLRFFQVEQVQVEHSDEIDDEAAAGAPAEVCYNYTYNLTTLPAVSPVLEGMEVDQLKSEFAMPANVVASLQQQIDAIELYQGVWWTVVTDDE